MTDPPTTAAEQKYVATPQHVDLYTEYAHTRPLDGPETALLRRLRTRWNELDMLDVGVGAGRTARVFSAIVHDYVGLDISPEMIERARLLIPEDEHTRLVVGDVTELDRLDRSFDVVLFSWNGIDSLNLEDRQRALEQMRSVLAPGGLLMFTTYSVHALPRQLADRPRDLRSLRGLYHAVHDRRERRERARMRSGLDLDAVDRRGWTRLPIVPGHPDLLIMHTTVAEQLRELRAAGLDLVEIRDTDGRLVDPDDPPAGSPGLGYFCTAANERT